MSAKAGTDMLEEVAAVPDQEPVFIGSYGLQLVGRKLSLRDNIEQRFERAEVKSLSNGGIRKEKLSAHIGPSPIVSRPPRNPHAQIHSVMQYVLLLIDTLDSAHRS